MLSKERNIGLDIMRCAAIILVLICHYSSPFYPFVGTGYIERAFNLMNWLFGFYGVEFFFILSGFLIGTIYFKTIQNSGIDIYKSLWTFMRRRWWRTLPNYYLFVILNIVVIYLVGGVFYVEEIAKSLLFLQKLVPSKNLMFFGVSWSLTVEEWFYFLLPISFILFHFFTKNRSIVLKLSIVALFLLPNIIKLIYIINNPLYADHEEPFRIATFFRLDSIFAGVLFSYFWQKEKLQYLLTKNSQKLALGGFLLLFFNFAYAYVFLVKPIQNSILYFLFTPLNCIALLAIMPFIINIKKSKFSVNANKLIVFISTISYSLYLAHVPIKELCDYFLQPYFDMTNLGIVFLYILMMLIFSFTCSYLTYQYFELKVLKMRDKLVKENF